MNSLLLHDHIKYNQKECRHDRSYVAISNYTWVSLWGRTAPHKLHSSNTSYLYTTNNKQKKG